MVNLFGSFSQIKSQKVLVVGDLMLDTYTLGKVQRISPEAPVPVLRVESEEQRPGGAGNVALNLISMGADVSVMGRVGVDTNGQVLVKSLCDEGIDTVGILNEDGYPTPVKNRVIANNQQMIRVDYEQVVPLHESLEQQAIEKLPEVMAGVALVAISDYGKGFITPTLMSAIVETAHKQGIPVVVDPKGVDFSKYCGADVIKPNLSEIYAAANLPPDAPLELAAERVLQASEAGVLLVTRSEEGISLFFKDGRREEFPTRKREVKDVTGAGDTVLAMLACALASGLSIEEGARLSNKVAGMTVERFGCARITLAELARRLLNDDVGNKVFDEEHLFTLQTALKGQRYVLLNLSGEHGLTTPVFKTIRELGAIPDRDLVIYVDGGEANEMFVDVLASLHDVDYIIVDSDTLKQLSQLVLPVETFSIKDGALSQGALARG